MLKICLITPNLLPVPSVKGGAIESLVTNIVKKQEEYKKLDLTVVSLYDEKALKESKKYPNTKFIYIKKNISYYITGIFYNISNRLFKTNLNTYNHFVLNKIKNMNFDYVVAEGGHYESYNKFLKYYKKENLIIHLHHVERSNEIIDKTFSRLLGVSDYVTNEFKKTTNKIDTYTLRNGIDLNLFDKEASIKEINQIKKKYGINKNDFIILFVGRLIPAKGVLELIKAVKKIDNPNIKLMILGNNPDSLSTKDEYVLSLEKEIEGFEKKIFFTGYVNNWEVYKYYQASNVVCIPSILEDAATLVCVEAMISRKIVLATNSGGIPEHLLKDSSLVVDKKENLIDNLKDGIITLYNKKDKFPLMAEKAYQHALKFNSNNMYLKLVSYLEEFKKEDEKNEI